MRIVFIGTGEIGVPTLQALLRSSEHRVTGVVTQPDKPAGRTQQIEPPPIKRALAGTKMSILQPVRIKGREAIEEVRTLRPEAIVVMAYGQILPRDLLEIPPVA
ncbi:MAG: methionyl-tRNA formyltransferase, partial [Verrucomicrobia bacterium]